jgi:hypothetical protein
MPIPDGPQHDCAPQWLIETQRREVEEVRDRSHPCQRAAASRRQHGDVGIAFRYVHLGPSLVVDRELVHRALAERQRPLIRLGKPGDVAQAVLREPDEGSGDRLRLGSVDVG